MIALACDHGGFVLMQAVKKHLEDLGLPYHDFGTWSEDSCDYPDYAHPLAESVEKGEVDLGIAICGSGIGISIACNKVKGVRCAKVSNKEEAISTRKDNDSNILALSEKTPKEEAIEIIDSFINTNFSNENRHINRINKIKEYEEKYER